MNKLFYSYENMTKDLQSIVRDMMLDSYKPDVIIGPGRGGYFLGVMLSHYFNVPFKGFNWQTRDGVVHDSDREYLKSIIYQHQLDNILVVDDINDTGKTLSSIDDEMFSYALDNGFYIEVKCATLFNKSTSDFKEVNYSARELTMDEDPWIVFPWEEWWV